MLVVAVILSCYDVVPMTSIGVHTGGRVLSTYLVLQRFWFSLLFEQRLQAGMLAVLRRVASYIY